MPDRQVSERPVGAAEFFSAWDSSESADAARVALERLQKVAWAKPLLDHLEHARKSGDRQQQRGYLWEARVGLSILRLGCQVQYEYKSGEGKKSIDFRVMSEPELLIEAIAIQNSEGSEQAGWTEELPDIQVFGHFLTSTNPDQHQTTAGEMARIVHLLTTKASKFPSPGPGVYHLIAADIRGYNAGSVDNDDCNQIALGAAAVRDDAYRQFLGTTPVQGIFDPCNTRPDAVRSQQKVHAIGLFSGSRNGSQEVLSTGVSVYRTNPQLITTKQEWDLVANLLDGTSAGE